MALIDAVEDEGGKHMDDLCEPITHRIRERPNGKYRNRKGTGCGDATIFKLPYKSAIFGGSPESDQLVEMGEMDDGSTAFMAVEVDEGIRQLRVCANDDDMGKWPRFADALNPQFDEDEEAA